MYPSLTFTLPKSAQGEAGTGNVVEAVRHMRKMNSQIRQIQNMDEDELFLFAKEIRAPYELVKQTAKLGRLPVVNFAAGGVATPADAALMMQLGCDGVFVGSVCLSLSCSPLSIDLASRVHALSTYVLARLGRLAFPFLMSGEIPSSLFPHGCVVRFDQPVCAARLWSRQGRPSGSLFTRARMRRQTHQPVAAGEFSVLLASVAFPLSSRRYSHGLRDRVTSYLFYVYYSYFH